MRAVCVTVLLIALASCTDHQPARGAPISSGSLSSSAASGSTGPAASAAGNGAPGGFLVESVTFVSSETGWVLGEATCPAEPCTTIARTTTGGASWERVAAPAAPLISEASVDGIRRLRFATATDGFAFGPALWITHDGGQRWSRPSDIAGIAPYYVMALAVTSSHVYALVAGVDLARGGADSHTRVVAASISADDFTVIVDFGESTSAPTDLIAAHNDAYAISETTLLHITGDAVAPPTALPPVQYCGPIASSSSDNLVVSCQNGSAGGAMGERHLFGSTDGGRSWNELPDPGAGDGYDTSTLADSGNGHAALGTSSATRSGLLVTTDYGHSWQTKLESDDAGAGYTEAQFQDATHAVVVHGADAAVGAQNSRAPTDLPDPGALFRTTDGGNTWLPVPINI